MIDISHALNVEGWMSPDELKWLATKAQSAKRILELGSWQGRSTVALAENTSGNVFSVDTWRGSEEHQWMFDSKGDWCFPKFLENTKELPVYPIRKESMEAADMFYCLGVKFDFIFLDASHDYESVKRDILAWRPLLQEGGVFAGHDFYTDGKEWPGVKKAVEELIPIYTNPVWSIWEETPNQKEK